MGRYGKPFILEVNSTTALGHTLGYIFHPFLLQVCLHLCSFYTHRDQPNLEPSILKAVFFFPEEKNRMLNVLPFASFIIN